jgi:hypothetical protein
MMGLEPGCRVDQVAPRRRAGNDTVDQDPVGDRWSSWIRDRRSTDSPVSHQGDTLRGGTPDRIVRRNEPVGGSGTSERLREVNRFAGRFLLG